MSIADTRRLLREAAGDCCRAAAWLDSARDEESIKQAKVAARHAAAKLDRAECALAEIVDAQDIPLEESIS